MVWLMVHESWFCSWFGLWYMVHGVLNNVLLENGGLPFIFPIKVHLDFGHHCNTQWYFYLNHVIPLRPFKTVLDNVLLEHVGLHSVLPYAVHPDLGHPPDTQEYLGLLSEPFNTTQTF